MTEEETGKESYRRIVMNWRFRFYGSEKENTQKLGVLSQFYNPISEFSIGTESSLKITVPRSKDVGMFASRKPCNLADLICDPI